MQIRLLLELVDEMVKNSLPEWMAREVQPEEEQTGACRDYDDFGYEVVFKAGVTVEVEI